MTSNASNGVNIGGRKTGVERDRVRKRCEPHALGDADVGSPSGVLADLAQVVPDLRIVGVAFDPASASANISCWGWNCQYV